jgi:hypothetical protein
VADWAAEPGVDNHTLAPDIQSRPTGGTAVNDLMRDVYWKLGGCQTADYEEFVRAVSEYQELIDPEEHGWAPEAVIAPGPITVTYTADWKDEDDTMELHLGEPGQPLTMGRALHELNNATVEFFGDADHIYFEGLVPTAPGVYEISIGS